MPELPRLIEGLDLKVLHLELSLLVTYLVYCAGTAALLHVVPERSRLWVLLCASLLYLAIFFSPTLTLFLLGFTLLLQGTSAGPLRSARLGLLPAAALLLAVFLPACFSGRLVELGPRGPLDQARGFVALFLLITYFKKALYYLYELRCGRVERADLAGVLVYFLSLPFLLGMAPVVSYTHFHDRFGALPPARAVISALRTIAKALLHFLGLALIRSLFNDLWIGPTFVASAAALSPPSVALALALNYLAFYAYHYGADQLSVGMARLHGFDIRDNYANPLAARDYADFWRRWNVHFFAR